MKRAIPLTLLLFLVPLSPMPIAVAADLNYTLYVLGVPVADAEMSVNLGDPAYGITLRFHTTGIADLLAADRLDEHTTGRFEGERPAPAEYSSSGRLRGQDRVVGMTWRDGTPIVTTITPVNSTEREDVPPALLAHAVNPLDVVAQLLREVTQTGRCEGSSRAYDGRRLQLLEVRTAGEEDVPPSGRSSFSGRALRCDFTDHTLAGFRLAAGRDDDIK